MKGFLVFACSGNKSYHLWQKKEKERKILFRKDRAPSPCRSHDCVGRGPAPVDQIGPPSVTAIRQAPDSRHQCAAPHPCCSGIRTTRVHEYASRMIPARYSSNTRMVPRLYPSDTEAMPGAHRTRILRCKLCLGFL